jgi:16S rRNA (cytosine1402-N4)-methyltransferase
MTYRHIPVMVDEVIRLLDLKPGDRAVDGTLGGAGHSRAILDKILPGGLLIGIDQDRDAVAHATEVLKPYEKDIRIINDNYVNLPEILSGLDLPEVDRILLDLGISLYQIESSGRGFSFRRDEPLDMRMDAASERTAEDLVNRMDESGLKKIFREYGEERRAGQIARKIVQARRRSRITTTAQLSHLVSDAIPKSASAHQRIHPATRVFMALRIAVNRELERLESFMDVAVDLLAPGGRLCILSFHSLEDRIVKHRFKRLEKGCTCPPDFPVCACNKKPRIRILTRRTLRPTAAEVTANPMARSTRLRAAEKI